MATNMQVAHKFAHHQPARAGSLHTDGTTAWSYTTPIAAWQGGMVLMDRKQYSHTTASHKLALDRALSGVAPIAEVPHVVLGRGQKKRARNRSNKEYLLLQVRNLLCDARRSRKYGASLLWQAERAQREVEAYCRHFGLQPPPPLVIPEDLRERAAVQAEATHKASAKVRETLDLWIAGEGRYQSGYHAYPVRLRVKGGLVETSHGANVPLDEGLKLFTMASAYRKAGRDKSSPEASVGPYKGVRIEANGDTRVGCHYIQFDEMERVYATLPETEKGRYTHDTD
jgi:hypothetical protein